MDSRQFSKEHLSAALNALVKVKGGKIDDKRSGICWNAAYLCKSGGYNPIPIIENLVTLWSKYTGSVGYPIPSTTLGYKPRREYLLSENKWIGEYGQLRYELLDFLIEELTKAVEEYGND